MLGQAGYLWHRTVVDNAVTVHACGSTSPSLAGEVCMSGFVDQL